MKMSDKELSSKIKELNIPKERVVKFACDCALVNIELIKPYTPDGKYQTIVTFLKNPASDVALAAAALADAWTAASYAANAAYYAAAYYAALAANTADTAYYADHAANAAYYAAAEYANAAGNSDKVDKLIDELFAEFE